MKVCASAISPAPPETLDQNQARARLRTCRPRMFTSFAMAATCSAGAVHWALTGLRVS